jgi:monothiol glutaredoxin
MNNEMKEKIERLIRTNAIVLFMKGTKEQPQCGFSSRVVEVLKQFTPDFVTVDVIADPAMREAIKVFSSWPTIPQLYVDGEFIGGCDIVLEMFEKEQLQPLLKVAKADKAPAIHLSPEALSAFRDANPEREEGECFRLSIGADFEHGLSFDFQGDDDFTVQFGDVAIIIDPYSAARADGLSLDFVKDGLQSGFAFDNPNEPPMVQELAVEELHAWLAQGKNALLIDVRPRTEWQKAHIASASLLEEMPQADLMARDKNDAIVFFCHHGGRSRRAAESFRYRGFKRVYNLTGGIDAWSRKIDNSVPQY